jgi:hypothetical protein
MVIKHQANLGFNKDFHRNQNPREIIKNHKFKGLPSPRFLVSPS